jgi:hypothetical protein
VTSPLQSDYAATQRYLASSARELKRARLSYARGIVSPQRILSRR